MEGKRQPTFRELQQIELEIDLRLREVWERLDPEPTAAEVAAALRYAYGRGYHDALEEDARGQRGLLGSEYGVRLDIPG